MHIMAHNNSQLTATHNSATATRGGRGDAAAEAAPAVVAALVAVSRSMFYVLSIKAQAHGTVVGPFL
jgi:hypothetical protein